MEQINYAAFIDYVRDQRRQGLSNSQIAEKLGMKDAAELVSYCRIAENATEKLSKAIDNAKVVERDEKGNPAVKRFPWKDEYDPAVEKVPREKPVNKKKPPVETAKETPAE